MDAVSWLGLEATHNPNRYFMPIEPGVCTGFRPMFLFGGCGLGAAIAAMEKTSGRPIVWATAQYLSYANPGSVLDVDVTIAATGKYVTQARAVGHVGDREVFTVNGALGERPSDPTGTWDDMPDVADPDDCPPRHSAWAIEGSFNSRLDQRVAVAPGTGPDEWPAEGDPLSLDAVETGRIALWTRMPEMLSVSASSLAILGDYVPMGIGQALGVPTSSNSLDNPIRVIQPVETDWYLLDIRMDAVRNGFGHGQVLLWSQTGELMATASQSAIVRERKE